ncbi:hypothetical protein BT96DRAFT_817106, partial [Gymnopus androsaceus JB14]
DMCNVYGTLHGGCAAYIIDLCSSTSIVCYGLYTGTDGTGVSSSMNIQWHRPITAYVASLSRLVLFPPSRNLFPVS